MLRNCKSATSCKHALATTDNIPAEVGLCGLGYFPTRCGSVFRPARTDQLTPASPSSGKVKGPERGSHACLIIRVDSHLALRVFRNPKETNHQAVFDEIGEFECRVHSYRSLRVHPLRIHFDQSNRASGMGTIRVFEQSPRALNVRTVTIGLRGCH